MRARYGVLAGIRHSLHEANGKNESRERRALFEPHADFASDLSYEVKTAREVLRLPERKSVNYPKALKGYCTV